ncbi:MAG TPA: hypothetical protein VFL66_09685 [Gaiellaceae bacterium]|nr:hypothetical protein [Gaiellaceae bacterium]
MVVPRPLILAALAAALAVAPAAAAATTPTLPVYDKFGHVVQTPFAPAAAPTHLDASRATASFLADPKVAAWLRRYPPRPQTQATYKDGNWTVNVWSGKAGEIATGTVQDASGAVTEAWTGPQVAWRMARGYEGAFGGKRINSYPVWLGFCAVFLLGLADWRRPLSLRNLDLLVLLSFSVSLWFFNRGQVFESAIAAYPPLLYLLWRALHATRRNRGAHASRPLWPVWLLAAATIFLVGFRIGLNVRDSNVIDVGYAGVIGADRIWHGQMPYGHFPVEDDLKPCGPADSTGEIRDRIQTNGRCESANPLGDTYGPVAYAAYLPGYWALGWSGKWDDLPAVHFTSILWDVIAIVGLFLVGRRYGGIRLAVTLAFAWAAYPFTQYASMSNTNDSIMPALLVWGFWLASRPGARGVFCALAGWTKFASFAVAPLWLTYPERKPLRHPARFLAGFLVATLVSLSVLALEPSLLHAARVFWDRTVWTQVTRHSPFSLWDWGQYHAQGIPSLHVEQRVLAGVLVAGAIAAAFFPRRKSPLQLAALTAALLVGLQLVLTYWIYLYIPWFFPFAAFVVLAPAAVRAEAAASEAEDERGVPQLVAAG